MATAGYSGKALIDKLGIKPESKVLLLNEPDNYFELLETDISKQLCKKNETPEIAHLFVKRIQLLRSGFRGIKKQQTFPPISLKMS